MQKTSQLIVLLVLAGAAFGQINPCWAQFTEQLLHSFGAAQDGQTPAYNGLIQARDGAWYGTTSYGGTNSAGTAFKLNSDGSGYVVLYSFGAGGIDGKCPSATLLQGLDGALYGTTVNGGTNDAGTVFRLKTDGSGYGVLYNFRTNATDGKYPHAGLVQDAGGTLYGTTPYGGSNAVANYGGIVFALNPDGSDYSVLYSFRNYTSNDGQNPSGVVLGRDGALYGTTYIGGTNAGGTVFKINTNGSGYTDLYSFRGFPDDGWNPIGLVQGADGALYVTTHTGGSNYGGGTVCRLSTDGTSYTLLYSLLSDTTAQLPCATAVQGADGALYGMTSLGGAGGSGTVFKLNTNGTGYADLLSFTTDSGGHNPLAPLTLGDDGAWYGTTSAGGGNGLGTVFRLTPLPPQLISLGLQADKTFQFSLFGASNFTYCIDASTDLLHWIALTNIINRAGAVRLTDPAAPGLAQRFYRAVWRP